MFKIFKDIPVTDQSCHCAVKGFNMCILLRSSRADELMGYPK